MVARLEEIETVGVVGAGTMGNGIAQVAATAGYDVVMRDIEDEFVERGMESVESSLSRLTDRGTMEEDEARATLDRIEGNGDRVEPLASDRSWNDGGGRSEGDPRQDRGDDRPLRAFVL